MLLTSSLRLKYVKIGRRQVQAAEVFHAIVAIKELGTIHVPASRIL
jgi:hypothetical protein